MSNITEGYIEDIDVIRKISLHGSDGLKQTIGGGLAGNIIQFKASWYEHISI